MALSTIIGDIPPFDCFVRRQFLTGEQKGHNQYEKAIAIGVAVRKDMALCFTVLLESGALWYEIPIHGIVTRKCPMPSFPLPTCQMWDCLSSEFTVHRYDHLRHLAAKVWLQGMKAAAKMAASYLFTIDFAGSFYADHPTEHKTLNVMELDNGLVVAYPNNRILWTDKTFTKPGMPMDYTATKRHFFCETWDGDPKSFVKFE